ncbi:MAG: hypothetical protein RIC14_15530 [Filomicrobium sp.]
MTLRKAWRAVFGLAAGSFGVLLLAATVLGPAPASAGVVEKLKGRWSGWGAIRLTNGTTEQVKCVATYFLKNSRRRVDQNLRCASASYKIDAKAVYQINGRAVTGTWEELSHSAKGDVFGTVSGTGFQLTVRGDTFSAKMVLSSTACKQSINISPRGLNISNISIGLKKC